MSNYGIIKFNSIEDSAGFFSNYFSALSTMAECLQRGLIPYVDASSTWFNPTCDFEKGIVNDPTVNPWNWWFDQSLENCELALDVFINRGYIIHDPLKFADQPNFNFFTNLVDVHCKIKTSILEEEDQLYKQHLQGKQVLGILARGTEMLIYHPEYPKVKLETWPDLIRSHLDKCGEVDTIFLVSDDPEIINTVTTSFDNVVYLENFFRRTTQSDKEVKNSKQPWWLSSPTGDPNHRRRLGEECLIQAKLLSRCSYFLGTCSGVSNAVQFFNKKQFKQSYIV